MNQTITTLALSISTTLVTDFRPIPNRLGLLGAIFRELGRSARARLGGQPNRERAALDFVRAHAIEGDAESVLDALDRFAREQRFMMNLGDGKGRILDELVSGLPANARVLELGTYCGYSAIRMARLLRGGGQVVSIEENPRHARIARGDLPVRRRGRSSAHHRGREQRDHPHAGSVRSTWCSWTTTRTSISSISGALRTSAFSNPVAESSPTTLDRCSTHGRT